MENSNHNPTTSTTALDFAVPDAAMLAAIGPYIRKAYAPQDPEWVMARTGAISNRRLGLRRWLKRMLDFGRNSRPSLEVKTGYESHWTQKDLLPAYIAGLETRELLVEWRGRGMRIAAQAIRRAHLLYFMRAIELLEPQTVLEVGCGNGNIVLTLAARFPHVRFSGVELTDSGVGIAKAMQTDAVLPEIFAAASPEPLLDMGAHRSVDLSVGNAARLPFADKSIDIIYTRLALEQMEAIRPLAMAEIARVARHAVVLIEPWRDFNRSDPGKAYVRRQGYFTGRIKDLEKLGFSVRLASEDLVQKVQFKAGPVIAVRR